MEGKVSGPLLNDDSLQGKVIRLRGASGKLKRRYRAANADIDGYLDDDTFLAQGLLARHNDLA
jgi:uncharacterized protein YyaL (SSP411 family)